MNGTKQRSEIRAILTACFMMSPLSIFSYGKDEKPIMVSLGACLIMSREKRLEEARRRIESRLEADYFET